MENKQLKSLKDLSVWQKAVDLVAFTYSVAEKFPKSELYGIANQMRRSAVSISSNIAEGFKRNHGKEKLQFYNIAYGSTAELEGKIEVSYKLNFLDNQDYRKLSASVVEVGKMIDGLIKSQSRKFPKSYILNSIFFFSLLYSLLYILNPVFVQAASLYFYPASATRFVGRSFSIGIYVSSADAAMNATEGAVSFPANKLEVISLSKSNSIINLWVQDPSFSNRDGVINFGGVVTNPGFQGGSGKILTVAFRGKDTGKAALSFSSGSVLANDGKGTNILASLGTAVITVTEAPPPAAPAPPINLSTIIDSTPPVNDIDWYNIDSIKFYWNPPAGATAMNYVLSSNPDEQLSETEKDVVKEVSYDLSAFNDGAWYFFARFKGKNGWGQQLVKRLQLDRTPPEKFAITRQDNDLFNARPVFSWQATDTASGVAYYQAKIGEGDYFNPESIRAETAAGVSYVLPPQSPAASRTLTVRAYDKAGNFREETTEFSVISANGWQAWWRALIRFLSQWGWIFIVVALLLVAALYFLMYRLIQWRRNLKKELQEFKGELRRDLKRLEEKLETEAGKGLEVDLRPSRIQKAKESLRKEVEHIEEDIKKEIKELDDFREE